MFWIFLPESPFLGLCVILKNLTDFCETVETSMDPYLVCALQGKVYGLILYKFIVRNSLLSDIT